MTAPYRAPHRATPEQWAIVRARSNDEDFSLSPVICELADRLAALEAAQQQPAPTPAGSLVEVVLNALLDQPGPRGASVVASPNQARAAIRAVAAAARTMDLNGQSVAVFTWEGIAQWLEQEANR